MYNDTLKGTIENAKAAIAKTQYLHKLEVYGYVGDDDGNDNFIYTSGSLQDSDWEYLGRVDGDVFTPR